MKTTVPLDKALLDELREARDDIRQPREQTSLAFANAVARYSRATNALATAVLAALDGWV